MTFTSQSINKIPALLFLSLVLSCLTLKSAMSLVVCTMVLVWLMVALNLAEVVRNLNDTSLRRVTVGMCALSLAGALIPWAAKGSSSAAAVYIGVLISCGIVAGPILRSSKHYEFSTYVLILVLSASCFLSVLTYLEMKAASYGGLLKDANLAQAVLTGTAMLYIGSDASTQKKKFIGLVVILTILQTQSKSASLALGLIGLAWWGCRLLTKPTTRTATAVGFTVATILGVYCGGLWALENRPEWLGVSLTTRASLIHSSLEMLKEQEIVRWFTGNGAGSWATDYPAFKLESDINSSGLYSHSDILDLTYEYGIFALIGYIALLAGSLHQFVNATGTDAIRKGVAPYILIAAAFNFILPSAVACLLLGIALWESFKNPHNSDRVQKKDSVIRGKVTPLLILAVAAMCLLKFLPLQLYWLAQKENTAGKFQQTIAWNALAEGEFYEPWHILAVKRIQTIDLQNIVESTKPILHMSLGDLDRALALNKGCVDCRILKVNLLLALGEEEKALEEVKILRKVAPQSYGALVAILEVNRRKTFMNEKEKRELALLCVQRGLSLEDAVRCAKI